MGVDINEKTLTSSVAISSDKPVSEIDEDECYVVIAHFADGTTAMSQVMQK